MAEWIDIARNHLAAARAVQDRHARSAISRAYYAVHVLLTDKLVGAGFVLPANRQTPAHAAVVGLIRRHLGGLGEHTVRELRAANRRLYAARLDADYNRRATVDQRTALQAVRDAHAVFALFGVAL